MEKSQNIGVWIDHRKAVIVSGNGEEIEQIDSMVEKQPARINGKRSTDSFDSRRVQADDKQQRGFTKHLNDYYEKVLLHLKESESVLIFGPGEAKGELEKHMEHNNFRGNSVITEAADKMTDRQIAAKVKNHFSSLIVKK